MAVWEENKHPRDENGQFTSKGNEGQGENKSNYKGTQIEKLTKLNGDEVYQFGTKDGDVLTFKSLDEAKQYIDNNDDFDNDFEEEFGVSDEDIMAELSDGDYYYGDLNEQEIYNLMAKRLDITPKRVEEGLKNQGFNFEDYQKYINDEEFEEEPQPKTATKEDIATYQAKVDDAIKKYGRIGGGLYDELDGRHLYYDFNDKKVKSQIEDKNDEDKPYDFDKWAKETNSDKTKHAGYIDTNKTYKPEEIMDIVSEDDDFDVIAGGGLDGNVWFKHKSGPHYVWNRQSGKIKLLSKNATNRYEGI